MLDLPTPCRPPHRTTLPEGIEGWVITRYADVKAVLADPRFVRDPEQVARLRAAAGLGPVHAGRAGRGSTLLLLDALEHTRIRRAVAPLFSARRTDVHRPMIDALAETLVGRCAGSGRADLVCDLAVPLAIGVLCQIAGLPPNDHARFGPWVHAVHRIDGGSEAGRRIVEAIEAMDRYLVERMNDDGGGDLTEDEVVALGRDLLVGGHESTANLISGGLALLLAEPSRLRRLHAEPAGLDATIEECLRLVAPFPQVQARYAAEAVDVGGVRIGAGEAVLADLAAADRDPECFPAHHSWCPDAASGHLSFGHGAHHCPGATLARREAAAAFRAVLTGLPDLQLACSPEDLAWEPGLSPTLRTLPVRFSPRPINDGTGS